MACTAVLLPCDSSGPETLPLGTLVEDVLSVGAFACYNKVSRVVAMVVHFCRVRCYVLLSMAVATCIGRLELAVLRYPTGHP